MTMTRTAIRAEVDYQVEEYELDINDAIENAVDAAAITFRAAHATYHCTAHLLDCTTDDHRGN